MIGLAWPEPATRRAAAVVVAFVVVVAGCTSGRVASSPPTRTPTTTSSTASSPTTASTATRTTATIGPATTGAEALDLADLPSCGSARTYTTRARWLPAHVPAGYTLDFAATDVGPPEPSTSSEVDFLLAELGPGGHLVAALTVARSGFPVITQPGFVEAADVPALHTVRHRSGIVAHVINRGDTVGYQVAEWDELGTHWVATSGLPVPALAAALAKLRLTATTVTDPSGRFTVVGRHSDRVPVPVRTRVGIEPVAGRQGNVDFAAVEIRPPAAGSSGLVQLPGPGATLTTVQGRLLAQDANSLVTTLPGGSSVAVTDNDPHLPPARLRAFVLSLRPVDPDDPRLDTIPLEAAWPPPPGDGNRYCRER